MIFIWYFFIAWQEPHNEEQIIELSRSTNVIPVEQHIFPSNNTETTSFMKYIQENTNVSNLFCENSSYIYIRWERNGIVY